MKVTVTFDPQDRKEVADTLYLVSPNTANMNRTDLAKVVRSYAVQIRDGEKTHSLKDVFSFIDSLNVIGR
jgi:hypothetical protein